jgi:hypothetical protein
LTPKRIPEKWWVLVLCPSKFCDAKSLDSLHI